MRFVKIRSKNHTADALRRSVVCNRRFVFRLGSTTPLSEIYPKLLNLNNVIEINSIQACKNSGNKITMKRLFSDNGVKSAEWMVLSDVFAVQGSWNMFPAIIKHKNSSKGNGIFFVESENVMHDFFEQHRNTLQNYIIEKYYNYSKEYRLHVTNDGCFYTCRKMLKNDAEDRWHRHDVNSVWIVEENELFESPSNFNEIEAECVKALNSVGLDVGACDIKVQSEKGKDRGGNPDFIIMEINSAPSLGEITAIKYKEMLIKIVNGR